MPAKPLSRSERTVLSVIAHAYLQHDRFREAAVLLETLDGLNPGDARTLRALALAQLREGKPNKALRTLERLAIAAGPDATFHLLRSQALIALSRPLEANVAMRSFVQLRNPSAEA